MPVQVSAVQFAPDAASLACGGAEGRLVIWDTSTWQVWSSARRHSQKLDCSAFSSDGQHLATGGDDHIVCLLNLQGELVDKLQIHKSPIAGVSFNDGDHLLVTQSHKTGLLFWDIAKRQLTETCLPDSATWSQAFVLCDNERVAAIASKEPSIPTASSSPRVVSRWLSGHQGSVWSMTLAPTARQLARPPVPTARSGFGNLTRGRLSTGYKLPRVVARLCLTRGKGVVGDRRQGGLLDSCNSSQSCRIRENGSDRQALWVISTVMGSLTREPF